MKKIIAFILSIAITVGCFFATVNAFAEDISWSYDFDTKTLYVSGSGNMENYSDAYSVPWYKYMSKIESAVVLDGVTSVGSYSFAGAKSLCSVTLAQSVTSVCDYAFSSCSNLNSLYLGSNIISISDSSMAFDGVDEKENFSLSVETGSYALYFAIKNNIDFDCKSIVCSSMETVINPKGMVAYFPYVPKTSGTYKFFSVGVHDTYGYIYDKNLKKLKSNDDVSSSNTNFSLTVELTKNETYYFAAKIYNSTLSGTFDVVLQPVNCVVTGKVYAMENQQGSYGNYLLTNATVNDQVTQNGYYSVEVNEDSDFTFSCDNVEVVKNISVDNGDVQDVCLMMCDVNSDNVVNGKDFAIMKKSNSKYLNLFENFANYRY